MFFELKNEKTRFQETGFLILENKYYFVICKFQKIYYFLRRKNTANLIIGLLILQTDQLKVSHVLSNFIECYLGKKSRK